MDVQIRVCRKPPLSNMVCLFGSYGTILEFQAVKMPRNLCVFYLSQDLPVVEWESTNPYPAHLAELYQVHIFFTAFSQQACL
jgi:hypothetical protein